ncbi:hypothetical protein LV779_33795 [Streptomyces thinghirensis]|nr:hypothetical protein [Streptomyces thinghirensis]
MAPGSARSCRTDKSDLAEKVHEYEKNVGRGLDIVYTYHDMSAVTETRLEGQLLTEQEQRVGEDRMLLLSWESKWWGGTKQQQPTWKQTAAWRPRRLRDRRPGPAHQGVRAAHGEEGVPLLRPGDGHPHPGQRHTGRLRAGLPGTSTTGSASWASTTSCGPGSSPVTSTTPACSRACTRGRVRRLDRLQPVQHYLCHKTDWLSFAQTQHATHDWIRANLSDDKP